MKQTDWNIYERPRLEVSPGTSRDTVFKPNGTYVSFKPVPYAADVSRGGIVLPNQPKRAQVIAVGPGKMLGNGIIKHVTVKEGDFIVMTPQAFIQEFLVNGETVYYVDNDFIAGTLEEGDVAGMAPGGGEEKLIHDTSEDLQVMKIVTN